MYLAIEIGGTKLQLAVGPGSGQQLVRIERQAVDIGAGAAGIRGQIIEIGSRLIKEFPVTAIGIGFGGPVDVESGVAIKSFHVAGWDGFPLAAWCTRELGVPTVIGNDADLAGLAEARAGGGRGHRVVFYSNIGTGIGGALVVAGHPYRGATGGACEIGHLRPGVDALAADQIVESQASGLGIAAQARAAFELASPAEADAATQLFAACDGQLADLSARHVAQLARQGNAIADRVLRQAVQVYGWALGQVVTLMSPDVIVVGGGVSLIAESLFLHPLRQRVAEYAMPSMQNTYQIVPAQLGEEVVLHGGLAWAELCQ